MHRFDVILWDIDGTLLTAGGVGRDATRTALMQVFGTIGALDTHHFGGKTDWYTLVELLVPEGFTEPEIATRLPAYAEVLAKHMSHDIHRYDVKALPAALEVVGMLREDKGMLQGIVTGNVALNVAVKLEAAGFDPDWFPFGAYGDESADRNVLPSMALERATLLANRNIQPERVLIVGDTVRDIEAARAVGAAVCIVETGFAKADNLRAAKPDWLLPDLTTFFGQVFS